MNCPNCRQENRSSAGFCTKCGTRLQQVCPQCGAEADSGDAFCGDCGANLSSAGAPADPGPPNLEAQFGHLQDTLPSSLLEQLLTPSGGREPPGDGPLRRYEPLVADDGATCSPEDAAALVNRLLQAMVDVLLKYGGRVDRFLGDGVLAVFGVPQAHEDDPERAIRAALAIREAAQRLGLEVTAGINTGEVYVGGVGSEQHQEVTVMGPVVNLASRLQEQAEPGQILVGEATYRQTRRAFEFSPLSLQIEGLAQPVAAYAVEQALPRPEKARGIEGLRAELIGRDEELAKLQAGAGGSAAGAGPDGLADRRGRRGQVAAGRGVEARYRAQGTGIGRRHRTRHPSRRHRYPSGWRAAAWNWG